MSTFFAAFMAFFAVMNPIANLPVFLSLVADETPKTRQKIAFQALFISFCIVAIFAFAGKFIFEVFDITLPALRITGGVVLFIIGYHMLSGKSSPVHHTRQTAQLAAGEPGQSSVPDRSQTVSIAVSPLAMPLLGGPGTIATAMNLAASDGVWGILATIGAFALLCVICYLCFRYGSAIVKFLGKSAMEAVTRLMGLLLAVIATQMLIAGIQASFPVLQH